MSGVKQVGGDHYVAAYQHWDMVVSNEVGYLEGNATKYVSRWRKKNGTQDIEKAISYVLKIRECYLSLGYRNSSIFSRGSNHTNSIHSRTNFHRWVREASIDETDASLCLRILSWETCEDLDRICEALAGLAALALPTPRPTPTPATSGRPTVAGATEHPAPYGYSGPDEVGVPYGYKNPKSVNVDQGFNAVNITKTDEGYNG